MTSPGLADSARLNLLPALSSVTDQALSVTLTGAGFDALGGRNGFLGVGERRGQHDAGGKYQSQNLLHDESSYSMF